MKPIIIYFASVSPSLVLSPSYSKLNKSLFHNYCEDSMNNRNRRSTVDVLTGALRRIPLRIKTKTVLEISALSLIVVLAIILRVLPIRWGTYFTAYDPLFQYRVTEYVVKNGYSAWFNWHDTLSWYPMGRDVPESSFPGLPFSAAFAHTLIHAFGFNISVYDLCIFFPLLMAGLTCIVSYFLGRDLGGGSAGLFTAFFMAVSTAFISRTHLGFFDTENIGIFGMVTTSLFFLRSIEKDKTLFKRALYAIAAGLSLAYLFASWGASRYVVGLLTIFMFTSLLTKLFDRHYLSSFCLTTGIGYFFALFIPKLGPGFLLSIENVAVFGFVILILLYDILRGRVRATRLFLVTALLLIFLAGGVFLLESQDLIKSLSGKFLSVLDPSQRSISPLLESVAEHKGSVWTSFFADFGFTIGLAIFGSYSAIHKTDEKRLFGLLFFLSSVYFAGSMIRIGLILSIPMSLMAAYGLKELLTPFFSLMTRWTERRKRRSRHMFGVTREMGVVFTAIIFVSTLPMVWSAASSAYRPTSLAYSAIPVSIGGSYPQDWLQALSWMRNNLPDDAIVVSWWDYGYWIETLANKTTLADGATNMGHQISQIAKVMMYNHSDGLPILEKYNATHIVVFNSFNPSDPSQEWPWGDNVKWSWMAQIAKLNVSDYFSGNQYTEKFRGTTIYRLMNLQADPNNFELVFSSGYRFVLVYKITY